MEQYNDQLNEEIYEKDRKINELETEVDQLEAIVID
jgi:hypothetical protein